ncbi:hypothetical protein JCM10207_003696 [Rhodosporidiobolus poonsookiae]
MGKRKSSKKPQVKRIKQVLDKSFRCVFCAHQGSVTCKMDNKNSVGRLDCKDCGQTFTTDINHLSEPVDVYTAWIDACEEANPLEAPTPRGKAPKTALASKPRKRHASDEEEDGQSGEAYAEPDDEDEDEDEDLRDVRVSKRRKQATPEEEEDEDE